MKLMLQFIAIGTFLFCISCKAKNLGHGIYQIRETPISIDKTLTKVMNASHKIDTAYINGDILTVKLHLPSFCKTDTIALVGNGKFAKSNPPMTTVFIKTPTYLNLNCNYLTFLELKSDISQLKYPMLNKVVINLDEYYKITYNY